MLKKENSYFIGYKRSTSHQYHVDLYEYKPFSHIIVFIAINARAKFYDLKGRPHILSPC